MGGSISRALRVMAPKATPYNVPPSESMKLQTPPPITEFSPSNLRHIELIEMDKDVHNLFQSLAQPKIKPARDLLLTGKKYMTAAEIRSIEIMTPNMTEDRRLEVQGFSKEERLQLVGKTFKGRLSEMEAMIFFDWMEGDPSLDPQAMSLAFSVHSLDAADLMDYYRNPRLKVLRNGETLGF